MQLTVLLIAVICVRWFGIPSWLHLDQWVKPWLHAIAGKSLNNKPWLYWLIALLVPLAVAAYALQWAALNNHFLEFVITAFILLYSIGREDFKAQVQAFVAAVRGEDIVGLHASARALQSHPACETLSQDKPELYHQSLLNAAYRAMERGFVVFFWFAMLRPIAALAYRFLRLYSDQRQQERLAVQEASSPEPLDGQAEGETTVASEPPSDVPAYISSKPLAKLIWLLEWPVVRALGLSFAITGNFISCMQRWRDSLLCFKTPSKKVLGNAVGGALNIDVDCKFGCEEICAEMEALQALFYRTGLFWLCALAIYLMLAL